MTIISEVTAPGSRRSKPISGRKKHWWHQKEIGSRGRPGGPANEVIEEPLAQITWPAAEMETALRAH